MWHTHGSGGAPRRGGRNGSFFPAGNGASWCLRFRGWRARRGGNRHGAVSGRARRSGVAISPGAAGHRRPPGWPKRARNRAGYSSARHRFAEILALFQADARPTRDDESSSFTGHDEELADRGPARA